MGINIYKKSQLTEKQLAVLESEMQKRKKSTPLTYVLWFFFGSIGAHQFYLDNTKRGFLYLGLWILIVISLAITFFSPNYGFAYSDPTLNPSPIAVIILIFEVISSMILAAFLLYDLFTIPRQIREANEKEEDKIIQEIMSIS